jgi:hypothetical protein
MGARVGCEALLRVWPEAPPSLAWFEGMQCVVSLRRLGALSPLLLLQGLQCPHLHRSGAVVVAWGPQVAAGFENQLVVVVVVVGFENHSVVGVGGIKNHSVVLVAMEFKDHLVMVVLLMVMALGWGVELQGVG